jgi:hypothetical protein
VKPVELRSKPPRLQARKQSRKPSYDFSGFDRAFYMYVRTSDGSILWNRSRSMLGNGHRPSAVALRLFQDFGVELDNPSVYRDPSRDREVLAYFAGLVMPDNIAAPSIFDDGGQA